MNLLLFLASCAGESKVFVGSHVGVDGELEVVLIDWLSAVVNGVWTEGTLGRHVWKKIGLLENFSVWVGWHNCNLDFTILFLA